MFPENQGEKLPGHMMGTCLLVTLPELTVCHVAAVSILGFRDPAR